jgi:hypothetical protein
MTFDIAVLILAFVIGAIVGAAVTLAAIDADSPGR